MYRHKPGDNPTIPDCPNIPSTAARQAAELLQAGVDYVATDATNLCNPSQQQLEIQQRPTEALLEEWAKLRQQGIHTPSWVVWGRLVAGCTTYPDILSLYNNDTYNSLDLIQRDPKSGKKMWITPANPDPSIVATVESNGGRNDIVVQEMWALFDESEFNQGRWSFMARCRNAAGSFTTMAAGEGVSPCNQMQTTGSDVGTHGTAMSVSPSF